MMSECEQGWKIKPTSLFGSCGILISNDSTLSFLTVDEAEAMLNKHINLEAENEDLRLMLYGQTGWTEEEINERLALLAAEAQE